MFIGQYDHSLDVKGRTFVPAKYRDELGESFIITSYFDGCLALFTTEGFEKFISRILSLTPNANERGLQRAFGANANEVSADKQGRILIPENLRKKAKLDKDIVFIGNFDKIEIWDRETWEQQTSGDNIEDLYETLLKGQ